MEGGEVCRRRERSGELPEDGGITNVGKSNRNIAGEEIRKIASTTLPFLNEENMNRLLFKPFDLRHTFGMNYHECIRAVADKYLVV